MTSTRSLVLTILLLAPTLAAQAQGQPTALPTGTGCTEIEELPTIIREPGLYCLNRDFEVDMPTGGAAISIVSDHVVLDFQGHILRNVAPQPFSTDTNPIGVSAFEQSHVVVRNGTVAGFRVGIALDQPFGPSVSSDYMVEHMRVSDCQRTGIGVGGSFAVVRDNVVVNITGSGESASSGLFIGGGTGHRVLDNDVSRVTGGGKANHWGIRFVEAFDNIATGNRMVATGNGILMDGTATVYRDNFVLQIPAGASAFSGGIDAGGNFDS